MLMSPASQLLSSAHIILRGRAARRLIFYDILWLKVGARLGARTSVVSISAITASPCKPRACKIQVHMSECGCEVILIVQLSLFMYSRLES